MIIYNVTTRVEWRIASEWVRWMKEEHIPTVMATNKFARYQFVKLLDVDDVDGPTYAVQYFTPSMADYEDYVENFATALREEILNRWGENFISFRSLMQEVE